MEQRQTSTRYARGKLAIAIASISNMYRFIHCDPIFYSVAKQNVTNSGIIAEVFNYLVT